MTSGAVLQVIDSIREHRNRFEGFCRSLSEEELARPVPESAWRVKDFISHLAAFDTEMIRWLELLLAGRLDEAARGDDGAPYDIDSWNNARVAERRDRPLEDILAEAARNREALISSMERLEDGHLGGTLKFPGDAKRPPAEVPFSLFLAGWARHDPVHVADMLKALPERASDPDVQAWLDDPAVKWYQAAMEGPERKG